MILELLYMVSAIVGLGVIIVNLLGSNFYDLHEANRARQARRHPHAKAWRARPLVTVIVTTQNNETTISAGLASLIQGTYRKLEIIVIDNASSDHTRYITKQFIREHPKWHLRLVARRGSPEAGNRVALSTYKRYGHGELIFLMTGAQLVDKQAIRNAVTRLNGRPDLAALQPNFKVASAWSLTGLFQAYDQLLRAAGNKLGSITNTDYMGVREGVIFRKQVWLAGGGQARQRKMAFATAGWRSYYADDVAVYMAAGGSFYDVCKQRYQLQLQRLVALRDQRRLFFTPDREYSRVKTWVRLPLAVIVGTVALGAPILLGYFAYMAFSLHEPTLLFLSWAAVSVLLLCAIWDDQQLRLLQKITYSLGVPITYGAVMVLSLVQPLVLLGSLLPRRKHLATRA